MKKPVIAFAGLTACSGCQLTLLNCEAELAVVAEGFTFGWFPLADSVREKCLQYDAALVEGAVSTPEDLQTLLWLRSCSTQLIAVGTCAVWGGIATIRNSDPRHEVASTVYGPAAEIRTFNPRPLSSFVTVDFAVTGCPPEKHELLATLSSVARGTLPPLPGYPVCTDCRNRENRCLLIEDNQLCLGPLIRAGCNARCPAVGIVCEGCRGPAQETNVAAELELLVEKGFSREEIVSRLHRFYPEWDHEQHY